MRTESANETNYPRSESEWLSCYISILEPVGAHLGSSQGHHQEIISLTLEPIDINDWQYTPI